MNIQCITLRAFQVNAYLLQDPVTQVCALVDTGFDEQLVETLTKVTPVLNIQAILLTHGHFDHAGGLAPLQEHYPDATTYLPSLEKPLFESLPRQGELVFGTSQFNRPCGRIDQWVKDGDSIQVGPMGFRFLSTPGHTPGQGCYYTDEYIFVGDTLFAGSVGRTDFPLSDPQLAAVSLSRLMKLPGHLQVHSGHGPTTTLQQELHTNPFLDHVRREQGIHTPTAYSFARHNSQY